MIYLSPHIYYNNSCKSPSLFVEGVEISAIDLETPYYCYTSKGIIDNYQQMAHAMPGVLICYAVKANPNISIIKVLASQGAGADVVSEGEMRRAMKANISRIIFSGVGKTEREIEFALKNNIYQINVESVSELKLVARIADALQVNAPIAVRINLDVDGETNDKISTCRKQDKFGIAIEDIHEIKRYNVKGLSMHIGSQISNVGVFKNALHKLKNILMDLQMPNIKRLDFGGGFAIPYQSGNPVFDYHRYYKYISEFFIDYQVIIEPGRSLVGNAGILIAKVLYIKRNNYNTQVIIDAGMNDLMRPVLYDAVHEIIPICKKWGSVETVDVVGPVCESGDTFVKQKQMMTLEEGDLVAICTAGAYGASMSNNYNSRLLAPEVIVKNNLYFAIRKRGTYEELFAQEQIVDL